MSIGARREYLKAIWFRYRQSSRKEKSVILTEYINVTGLNRKYAIWRLSQPLDRFDGSRRDLYLLTGANQGKRVGTNYLRPYIFS
jgi:hypothetical protein